MDDDLMLLSDLSDKDIARLTASQILELGIELRPGRVLLADDDADIREYVGTLLETLGITVTCATNPDQAEQVLRDGMFDLVLVDFVKHPTEAVLMLERLHRVANGA